MARSLEWWVLVAAAAAVTLAAIAMILAHGPAATSVRDDPISQALVGG